MVYEWDGGKDAFCEGDEEFTEDEAGEDTEKGDEDDDEEDGDEVEEEGDGRVLGKRGVYEAEEEVTDRGADVFDEEVKDDEGNS